MSTPLSGRRPHPTPIAGSLPAVAASRPLPPVLPPTDPPPRASKARELYLRHHATPSLDGAFEVLGVALDELDEVHEETAHVSQRQTAIEQQMSEGFKTIRGGLSNIADDMLKTAEAVRQQGIDIERMETGLIAELGKTSRQGSSHDLADAQIEARLATEHEARLAAEKQAYADREELAAVKKQAREDAAAAATRHAAQQEQLTRHEMLLTPRQAVGGGVGLIAVVQIVLYLLGHMK